MQRTKKYTTKISLRTTSGSRNSSLSLHISIQFHHFPNLIRRSRQNIRKMWRVCRKRVPESGQEWSAKQQRKCVASQSISQSHSVKLAHLYYKREGGRKREGFLTGESTRDDAAYGKRTRPGPAGSGYLLHVMGWGEGVGHAKYPRFSCELSELPLLNHRLFPIQALFFLLPFFFFLYLIFEKIFQILNWRSNTRQWNYEGFEMMPYHLTRITGLIKLGKKRVYYHYLTHQIDPSRRIINVILC